jgi:two-component system sensor kinase FixL
VILRIRALFKQAIPNKAILNMNEVIAEVLDLLSNELHTKRIAVDTSLSINLPNNMADRVQMQQLVANLVHNAMESMEDVEERRKSILIHSKIDDQNVLSEVGDCGTGLTDPSRIFDPFFTTKEKGMGIGLSICRSIVDAHEGRLWAIQNECQGTTFSFALPATRET